MRQATRIFLFLAISSFVVTQADGNPPPVCSSKIYCQGKLLHAVQVARIFKDSKTFVDMKMVKSENSTLKDFDDLLETNPNPSRDDIQHFVSTHFIEGNELMNWTLPDRKAHPPFLDNIADPAFKKFAQDLLDIWPTLARKVSPEVDEHPERYSLVSIPHGFIIPGGRFKEIYYWDSYWIIEGLLISGMTETAKGMIENFIHLVKKFGHIPNGSRVYYAERSQPPLLTAMAAKYLQYSQDVEWIKENLPTLEEELMFWKNKRSVEVNVDGKKNILLRYYAESLGPRPESYYEDFHNAADMVDEKIEEFYTDLKSAAESGWDFSSRWFVDANGGNSGNLTNLHTKRIIPVDLNSIYASALETVGNFNNLFYSKRAAQKWWSLAEEWRHAIDNVLWNDEDGMWYDYDININKHRKFFFPSNLSPAWRRCVEEDKLHVYAPKVIKNLKKSGALEYLGGVPTSVSKTGEQWDLPNAWPPLQSIMVQGLENLGTDESKELARELAEKWVRANHKGFGKYQQMFEKYDAEKPGEIGGGGEYDTQTGFGWSNGVVLEFLNLYGRVITSREP